MKPNSLACAIWIVGLLSVPGAVWAQAATPAKVPGAGMLPPTIPIFPLPDAMLFPNVSRPLHIFEPRYRAMVTDALKGDRIIGMVMLQTGYEADYEGRPPVYAIGCAGVITDVEELPDGRFNIVLRGSVKFRVTSEDQSRAYRLARVEALPELLNDEDRVALHKQRQRLETLLTTAAAPGSKPPPPEIADDVVVNALAQYLDLDRIDRQALLERDGALSRAEALIELLDVKAPPPR
jgi:Lon protease-like protein